MEEALVAATFLLMLMAPVILAADIFVRKHY
jgi:hypothetical protein